MTPTLGSCWRVAPDTNSEPGNVYMVVGKVGREWRMRLVNEGNFGAAFGYEMIVETAWFSVRGAMPAASPGAVRRVASPERRVS